MHEICQISWNSSDFMKSARFHVFPKWAKDQWSYFSLLGPRKNLNSSQLLDCIQFFWGFWLIWHSCQWAYIIMIHDFITIWDHDLGSVGICGICVCLSRWEYLSQKLHILQVYHIMLQYMHRKYLVDMMCTFWVAAILLKFLKWLSCLHR